MKAIKPDKKLIRRQTILGIQISAINMAQAVDAIAAWLLARQPHYICVTPAHGVMDARREPELASIFNNSGLTTPDGMAIVWLLRLYGYSHVTRVYGPDLMLAVCKRSVEKGWRHFFYGGAPGVAEALKERLQARFPGLQVAGTFTPPFRSLTSMEDQAVIEKICVSGADIVWVGLSTPKQERWMAAHVGRVNAPVLIGVGAAFDFLSGHKPQAPRWMQRNGLEWLFRFASEPCRLWRRYFKYPSFILLVWLEWIKWRRNSQV